MFLSMSGTYRKYLVHRSLIEAEILTSLLPNIFAQFGLVLGGDALPMGVFTHPKWYTNVSICLRNLPNKCGARGFNRS